MSEGKAKHPMQPVEWDGGGVIRFKDNAIVRHLLDNGGIDLNQIARLPFSQEDRTQFAQLIGYSVSGFSELSYVADDDWRAAEAACEWLRAEEPSDPRRTKTGSDE